MSSWKRSPYFDGFTLSNCQQERHFLARRRKLEELVRRACCEEKLLTVRFDPEQPRKPLRILLGC